MLPERPPAVAAIHELVGEAEFQFRVRREVGDRADAQLLRQRLLHAERVRVVEAEKARHADAAFGERRLHVLDPFDAFAREDFLADRPGVFRVYVDIAAQQRLPQHARPAELALVVGRYARLRRDPRDHFAQDDGLGELLGTNDDLLRERRNADRAQHDRKDQLFHDAASISSSGLRCI